MIRLRHLGLLIAIPLLGLAAARGPVPGRSTTLAAPAPLPTPSGTRASFGVVKRPPLVLMVVLDTLRADHAGPLAAVRGLTPRLDALARRSLVFPEAASTSSWTLPAMASVFTSLLPAAHGAQRMGDAFGADQVTLTEALREHGFRSMGVITNGNLDARLGFGQGFDRYGMPPAETMTGYPGEYPVHDARAVTAYALSELRALRREDPQAPVFLYAHYVDPHDPYMPHRSLLPDAMPRGRFGGARSELDEMDLGTDLTDADKDRIRWLYRGEVAFADRWVGRLLDGLARELGSLDDAVIVVLADHGEGLWDHGRRAHGGDLHDEQLRVPLLVHLPGMRDGDGRVIGDQVSLIDVAPTILDAVGAEIPAVFQGASLLPLRSRGRETPAYAELEVNEKRLAAVRTRDYKLICDRSRPGVSDCRMYDLQLDPGETVDVAQRLATQHVRRELERRLAEHARPVVAPAPKTAEATREMSPETVENLRALGYVSGASDSH